MVTRSLPDSTLPGQPMHANGSLFSALYGVLRQRAHALIANERRSHTLPATALVHEAYLKLFSGEIDGTLDPDRFQRMVFGAMRQILIDHARATQTAKRDRHRRTTLVVELADPVWKSVERLRDLHEAIDRLEKVDPLLATVARLMCLAGLNADEIAGIMRVSERQVFRWWRTARAWLKRALEA